VIVSRRTTDLIADLSDASSLPGKPQRGRLLVDVSAISRQDFGTGIQRVVRSIWSHLSASNDTDLEIVPVFATRDHGYHALPLDWIEKGGDAASEVLEITARCGDIFVGLDLSAHLLPRHERQIREWKKNGAVIYLFVYDLLPVLGPKWFRWRTRRNFKRWLHFLGRQADGAICISQAVATDLTSWLSIHVPERACDISVAAIRLGHDIREVPSSGGLPAYAGSILERMRKVPTILMVGTIEPRKGYEVALAAFRQVWNEGHQNAPDLMIVGRPGWKTERLQARMRELESAHPGFRWLDDASDEFLHHLYRASSGLLFCSYAEGYGLPLVEAASLGVPALVRDIPVFRELAVEGTEYFADDNSTSLAKSLFEFVEKQGEATATQRVSLPSWADATADLLAFVRARING
jgi:glycosyltransferase involved in cell wall biosynthesis